MIIWINTSGTGHPVRGNVPGRWIYGAMYIQARRYEHGSLWSWWRCTTEEGDVGFHMKATHTRWMQESNDG